MKVPLFESGGKKQIDPTRVPRHIAIIMDGNGRWAKKRGLPRTAGHAAGSETFRRIGRYCKKLGVKYLTVYAFSTENWKRPADEVAAIMQLLEKYLDEAAQSMRRENRAVHILGDVTALSARLRELIARNEEIAAQLQPDCIANLCINYGGRDEIVRAARAAAGAVMRGEVEIEKIDEAYFSSLLYTREIPDPDLIIRPSGEVRISNFLLWQSAYAEFYFDDTLWPDFTERTLDRAIVSYQSRARRFGGI